MSIDKGTMLCADEVTMLCADEVTMLCADEVTYDITRKTSETDKQHITSEVNQGWGKGGDLGEQAETIASHNINNIESRIDLLNNASQPWSSIYDAKGNWGPIQIS